MTPRTVGVPITSNEKLAGKRPASATYRTADTCPTSCLFLDRCYAAPDNGPRAPFRQAERHGQETPQAFARLTRDAPFRSVLRHLVSGDVTPDYLTEAAAFHAARPDVEGYGYSHRWEEMSPADVEGWTCNASTETPEQVEKALAAGWQAVITSPPGATLAGTRIAGRRVVSCPNQTDDRIKCSDCRLCRLDTPTRPVIEFVWHGRHAEAAAALILDARA